MRVILGLRAGVPVGEVFGVLVTRGLAVLVGGGWVRVGVGEAPCWTTAWVGVLVAAGGVLVACGGGVTVLVRVGVLVAAGGSVAVAVSGGG